MAFGFGSSQKIFLLAQHLCLLHDQQYTAPQEPKGLNYVLFFFEINCEEYLIATDLCDGTC